MMLCAKGVFKHDDISVKKLCRTTIFFLTLGKKQYLLVNIKEFAIYDVSMLAH